MKRPFAVMLVLGVALAASASVALSSQAASTLTGTVGPGYKISLRVNGKPVTSLKAGSYAFVVTDKGRIHNFVLEKKKGGTFEKELTSILFTGTKSVKIKLSPGEWEFYCRPHESLMHGDFTVK